MKHPKVRLASIHALAFLLLAVLRLHAVSVEVKPTLLPPGETTLVTATATSGRFYSGSTAPPFRVRLTRDGELLNLLNPVSVSQTRVTFRFPAMDPGLYGFILRAQNPITGVWLDVYESSPRFFRVAPSRLLPPRGVFNAYDTNTPSLQVQAWEFVETQSVVATGAITGLVVTQPLINDADQAMNWGWLKDFSKDREGPAGFRFELDAILKGYQTNRFTIPFEMDFEIPRRLASGTRVLVAPSRIRFTGSDQVTGNHAYDFTTRHRVFANIPYDLTDPVDATFLQEPTQVTHSASIPGLLPLTSVEIGPITVHGILGVTNLSGVHLGLAGHVAYQNQGAEIRTFPDGTRQTWTQPSLVSNLWYVTGDLIEFLAHLPQLGAVQEAAAVMSVAGMELNLGLGIDLRSSDFIHLKPINPFEFSFKAPSGLGNVALQRSFDSTVEAYSASQYEYILSAVIRQDMPFADEMDVYRAALDTVFARQWVVPIQAQVHFSWNATVELLPTDSFAQIYAPSIPGEVGLANYTLPEAANETVRISSIALTPPPLPDVVESRIEGTYPVSPGSEFALLVATNPPPHGIVTASPAPVDGGYALGTPVRLLATPEPGYAFVRWSGDISGTANPMTVVMDDTRLVTPVFALQTTLRSSMANGVLTLSWDAGAGYVLESASEFSPVAEWLPVPIGDDTVFTVPLDQAMRFYRLRFVR